MDVGEAARSWRRSRHASTWGTADVPISIGAVLVALVLKARQQVLACWVKVLTRERCGGRSHQLVYKWSIWRSSCLAICVGLDWDRVVSVVGVSSKTSLSSVDVIGSTGRLIRDLLSPVLAASETADTLLWEENADCDNDYDDASNHDTGNATTAEALFLLFNYNGIKILRGQGQSKVSLSFTGAIEVEFNHLTRLSSVILKTCCGLIHAAALAWGTIAVSMKETSYTGSAQGRKRSIQLVDLRLLIGDMKVELITSLVALVREVPETGLISSELGCVRDLDELVVGLDPFPVSEASLVGRDWFRCESFGEKTLVEAALSVIGEVILSAQETSVIQCWYWVVRFGLSNICSCISRWRSGHVCSRCCGWWSRCCGCWFCGCLIISWRGCVSGSSRFCLQHSSYNWNKLLASVGHTGHRFALCIEVASLAYCFLRLAQVVREALLIREMPVQIAAATAWLITV